MKPFNRLLSLAALLALALSFAACDPLGLIDVLDDDEEEETPVTPSNPETPTDKNTVTVTPEGSKVTRGDFSINFPSGTFTKDVQVTVTNVTAGDVYGDLEVSKFYKVKMPVTTNKSSTVRIKSEKLDDDVVFIRRAESWARSAGKTVEIGNVLEATYVDGEYKVTLPIYDNGEETERAEFTIGLAHPVKLDETRAGATTRSSETAVAEGQVKDVKWKVYIDPKAKKVTNSWKVLTTDEIAKVNGYIKEAITKIMNLGFELRDKNRVIPYYYVSDNTKWGYFSQGYLSDKDSWIGISIEHLIGQPNESTAPRSTLIHETFHYFQSDYDPRGAYTKKGGFAGTGVDNENILYEMGAVWMEQWMRNGQLDASFVKQEFDDVFKGDHLGFGLEEQRWGLGKHDSNQKQGYIMGPYLYYLTTEWGDIFLKKDILNLHLLWREKWKSKTYNSYYIFYEWVKKQHDVYLLDFTDIDNYYLKLFKGELVKGFEIGNLNSFAENDNVVNHTSTKKKFDFTGMCYPYGCGAQKVILHGFNNKPITDKEIVIKQMNSGVQTYLIWLDGVNNDKYHCFMKDGKPFATTKGDSIVISGAELEAFRRDEGSFFFNFYLLTTNTTNTIHSTTINPYHATFELRDGSGTVTPKELSFPAEGGTQKLKVTASGFTRFGFQINSEYSSWLSGKTSPGGIVEVTAQPNTSSSVRTGYVKIYLTNEQNPTEEQKTFLPPIKVTQEAGEEEAEIIVTGLGNSYDWSAWFATRLCMQKSTEDHSFNYVERVIFDASKSSFEQSGDKLHVTAVNDDPYNSMGAVFTISFDIINLKGDLSNLKVTNFKYTDSWSLTHKQIELTFTIDDFPIERFNPMSSVSGYAFIDCDAQNVSSFSYVIKDDYVDDITHTLIPDPEDYISINIYFRYTSRASSAPRRPAPLLLPQTGSDHGQADLE